MANSVKRLFCLNRTYRTDSTVKKQFISVLFFDFYGSTV